MLFNKLFPSMSWPFFCAKCPIFHPKLSFSSQILKAQSTKLFCGAQICAFALLVIMWSANSKSANYRRIAQSAKAQKKLLERNLRFCALICALPSSDILGRSSGSCTSAQGASAQLAEAALSFPPSISMHW